MSLLPVNEILHGDALTQLKTIQSKKVNCCFTSPPYYKLRDYDDERQLGQEPTVEQFIDNLVTIFDEVHRILTDDGALWVVIGDTYSGNKKGNTNGLGREGKVKQKEGVNRSDFVKKRQPNIPAKSLMMVPERFAIKMTDRGWILRNKIIWHKKNAMPDSASDRFTVDYEYVYFFTKSNKTLYWENEHINRIQYQKPPGTEGIEGIDWYWEVEIIGKYHKQAITEKKWKKVSYWNGRDYYFDTQYEPYQTDPKILASYLKDDYEGQSQKDYESAGAQNASDSKRRMIASIRSKAPRFGGNKAVGYGNPTYSGKQWTPHGFSDVEYRQWLRANKEYDSKEPYKNNMPKTFTPEFGRKKRCVWSINTKPFHGAHFAVFPEALVEIPLKATCPQYVCKRCGWKSREHYTVTRLNTRSGENVGNGKSGTDADPNKSFHNADISRYRQAILRRPTGYRESDCGCSEGYESGIVIDPFFGSGTVGVVAIKQGKRFIGIELNKDYIEIANKRIGNISDTYLSKDNTK